MPITLPNTITPLEFVEEEAQLLQNAWVGLHPNERDKLIQEFIDRKRREGFLRDMPEIPSWDNFIKLPILERRKTVQQLKDARAKTMMRILTSPTPPSVRALGSVINAIDDLEDVTTFVSVIGRLVVRFGPKLLGRFVPGLNVLITLSDVLNILTLATLGAGIAAGVNVGGVTALTAGGIGLWTIKGAIKSELWELMRLGMRKRVQFIKVGDTLKKILTKGNVIESLQATETIWGYGISLGGAMGYVQDVGWQFWRSVFGPMPRGAEALRATIAAEVPPEWMILDIGPRLARPCFDRIGLGPAAFRYAGLAYAFVRDQRPLRAPRGSFQQEVC